MKEARPRFGRSDCRSTGCSMSSCCCDEHNRVLLTISHIWNDNSDHSHGIHRADIGSTVRSPVKVVPGTIAILRIATRNDRGDRVQDIYSVPQD
jgi:hypothetical protein